MRLFVLLLLSCFSLNTYAQLVKDKRELELALSNARPGDVITMVNGVWKDVALKLSANGTAEKPIRVVAQTPGGVIISGASNLKISGHYLEISGLHFKDGYSPEGDLIVFKTGTDALANHCRITDFVIEDFSQADRFKNDNWIVLWGKYNRVDHCTISNKMNAGPTLIVELNDERSQENYHSIDHNYFNGRQRLGSNGGETMRIGVSRYSLTASRTMIKNNYFEHCNGEVEIVSIKSGENEVSNNTFYECEGSVVLRHGSKNVVDGNLFLGNNKAFTGGVRVINPGHKVFNNVFKDLKGSAFRAALAVMNGVPNSAINRYYQVKDAAIYHNTFINCDHIDFGTGKDAERTLAPENVEFKNNLVVTAADAVYTDYNQQAGLLFSDNAVSSMNKLDPPQGFESIKVKNKTINGIPIPITNKTFGVEVSKIKWAEKKNTGTSWFKPNVTARNLKNKKISIKPADVENINQLLAGLQNGDTILFSQSGNYKVKEEIIIKKELVLMAEKGLREKPVLVNVATDPLAAFITIENGGKLWVDGLAFSGTFESFGDVQAGIKSTTKPMNKHYNLNISNCRFYNFSESTFSAIKATKSTFADSITIKNTLFDNISGTAIDFSAEKEDKGIYNAEYMLIENCVFSNILGSAINLYRGGNDESTLGPFLTINQCSFNNVDNREKGAAVRLIGVQHAAIFNSIFYKSGQGGSSIKFEEYLADDLNVDYCNFYQSGKISSTYGKMSGKYIYSVDPGFANAPANDFTMKTTNAIKSKPQTKNYLGANLNR
jgi:poly(beta-D-mannuronate) lyase